MYKHCTYVYLYCSINVKPHLDYIKKGLAATNPQVRTCAIGLIGTLFLFLGQQLRMFFEEEKPALLQQIDAEIEKVSVHCVCVCVCVCVRVCVRLLKTQC